MKRTLVKRVFVRMRVEQELPDT